MTPNDDQYRKYWEEQVNKLIDLAPTIQSTLELYRQEMSAILEDLNKKIDKETCVIYRQKVQDIKMAIDEELEAINNKINKQTKLIYALLTMVLFLCYTNPQLLPLLKSMRTLLSFF